MVTKIKRGEWRDFFVAVILPLISIVASMAVVYIGANLNQSANKEMLSFSYQQELLKNDWSL